MTTIEIAGGRALVEGQLVAYDITLRGATISSVQSDSGVVDIDAAGLIVSPGFIDLQVNGGFGIDLVERPVGMWELGRRLPPTGVTSFLPTIITSPSAVPRSAIKALRLRPTAHSGAEPLGLHFEGPMLNPARRGAHPPEHFVTPSAAVVDGWTRDNGVVMVTIAPELTGALTVISELVARGVKVALGHTNATGSEAGAAIGVGATAVTHLFNAMAPLNHREPNLVGVALADPKLVAGLIVDGTHIDPVVVRAAWNAKGRDGIALVTDAVAAMGHPPGTYEFSGRQIIADEHGVRYSDGTIAGSAITMDAALRNLVEFTGCSVADALVTATRTPADLLGIHDRGRIEPHARADLVILDPSLEVQIVICGGRVMHVATGARDRVAEHLKENL
jgi:N-acetylglucosamine-6-phosphate deacetylase